MGQTRLLLARRSIEATLADATTAEPLRARLALVLAVRGFASELGLDVGSRYTTWAPWPGDRVVTTVVATKAGSLEPATRWFPIAGRVPYLGFFDPQRAEAEAARRRAEGLDVCVSAVSAYSTLGWIDDPVPEPLLRGDEARLVETLLHELVHHSAYVPGDTAWNEGLATWIGEEAAVAFHAQREPARVSDARREIEADRALARRLARLRGDVRALYAAQPAGAERDAQRARLGDEARADVAAMELAPRDAAAVARRLRTNDACLALDAAYTDELSRWAEASERVGGLRALVAEAKRAARAPDPRALLP